MLKTNSNGFKPSRLPLAIGLSVALLAGHSTAVLGQEDADASSTVVYQADYFDQYQPFSVNDMLVRIPGIDTARGGGGGDRRGLGAGGDQVLINGRRIAGKGNEGNAQLSRIPASEVEYIEIIRGTSGDLDVRGGNQVINVVLTQAEASVSYAYEVNADHYHDGKIMPGAKLSATGQNGALNFFLSAELEPRWEFRDGFENGLNVDGSLSNTVDRDEGRDAWPTTLQANLGYEFTRQDTANLNLQWNDNAYDAYADRVLTDLSVSPASVTFERDEVPTDESNWEIGGDYMHVFGSGNRWKTLFIVNDRDNNSVRSRYQLDGESRERDLFLSNIERTRERIVRSSYIANLTETQSVEAGVERAQTILDTSLQLGLAGSTSGGERFGGLAAVTDSVGTVEEMRYEYFAIHNWQLNARMSIESTMLFEDSTIAQTGSIDRSRDFTFFRPRFDYRFDLTSSVQFRATVEKNVAQLSFRDFTAGVDGGDDEQNAFEGNSNLRQQQWWQYEGNLEYRLPNDAGVVSGNVFYQDLDDLIDNVDVSTGDTILSARGNIGTGERYGFRLNSSLRLGFLNQPQMLVTAALNMEESTLTDPFLQQDRERSMRGGGSSYSFGFRHDIPSFRNMNYGLNYRREFYNEFRVYDIDKIEQYPKFGFYSAWVEAQGNGGMIYRFEVRDARDRCRVRTRYTGGTIATGFIEEIEDSCSDAGPVLAIKIRGTF
ncbi:MAG: TonB-dependent receptor plug domain-containing protein [Gammaproteobacteria bacterium]|jgi:outer membrane cobalamin receptor|nr:TonB-dependent receptor plug domain-containing protein [Gammaproteobacteria bacterium]